MDKDKAIAKGDGLVFFNTAKTRIGCYSLSSLSTLIMPTD